MEKLLTFIFTLQIIRSNDDVLCQVVIVYYVCVMPPQTKHRLNVLRIIQQTQNYVYLVLQNLVSGFLMYCIIL